MANVTLDLLYHEIKSYKKEMSEMRKELHELKGVLIPTEQITDEEHEEIDALFKEIRSGKGTPWREALRT